MVGEISVYQVLRLETENNEPFKAYEAIDKKRNLLFNSRKPNAFIRPLEKGKPVERPLQVGDLAQVLFGNPQEYYCGAKFQILEERTISTEEFKSIEAETERDFNDYNRRNAEFELQRSEALRQLEDKMSKLKPLHPAGLEQRVRERLYGPETKCVSYE